MKTTLWGALLLCSGCVFASPRKDENKPEDAPVTESRTDARVRPSWQERMLTELGKDTAVTEAWGMFTEGGWSDAGQVMVLVSGDRKAGRVLVVPPNKQDVKDDRALSAEEWGKLAPLLAGSDALADVNDNVFDGLVYELVHAKKDGAAVQVVDRLFVKSAGKKDEKKEYGELLEAFQTLRKASR